MVARRSTSARGEPDLRLGPLRPVLQRLTAPLHARPTFLVIGAQKAGTTSLHRYLVEHPAVLCAEPKQVHFFDNGYDLGSAWYLTHFPARSEAREIRRTLGAAAVGEVAPAYLFHPQAAQRAHAFDPGLRLLAVLRDRVALSPGPVPVPDPALPAS